MLISSLVPDELPLGTGSGGGVFTLRSSKLFQNPRLPEFLKAVCEKALEDRRLADSLPMVTSSGISSRLSGRLVQARMFGDDAVVVG